MIEMNIQLLLSFWVFVIGLAGCVINWRQLVLLLACVELMLLGVNMNLIAAAKLWGNISGEIMVFFILAVAAAESAIGLALLILMYRQYQHVDGQYLTQLKG